MKTYESFISKFRKQHKAGKSYTWYSVYKENFETEPTSMEDTIKFCIKWYPTLFEGINAREKALTNIFFAIGGDYDWDLDGRRSVLFEYFINDKTMMKYLFDEYNSDHRKNWNCDRI
jgi:hypothetical protein